MNDFIFGIDDRAFVKRTVRAFLKANHKRNIYVIVTIALTAFMLTSILSMGMSYSRSIEMEAKRFEGSLSHLAFNHPTDEQISKMQTLDYIKTIGQGVEIGQVGMSEDNQPWGLNYVDKNQWKEMFSPTYMSIEGTYALSKNDIMVSTYLLDAMGIDKPYVGMPLTLTYKVVGKDLPISKTFKVVCIFNDLSQGRNNHIPSIYVSKALAEDTKRLESNDKVVNVLFTNDKVDYHFQQLKADIHMTQNQEVRISPAYGENNRLMTYIIMLALLVFIMLAGFLLIYNVMYISVANHVRLYGMLRTIGASGQQIKKIVLGQMLRLSLWGIPLGLIFSLLVTVGIIPKVLVSSGIQTRAVLDFSPFIYLGGVVFTLFATRLGMRLPIKKAMEISPMEALLYTNNSHSKKPYAYQKTTGGKAFKMAWRNFRRDTKRTVIVLLSLIIGILTFSSVMVVVKSMDIDHYIEAEYPYDYSIHRNDAERYFLNDEIDEKIKNLEGIKAITRTYIGAVPLKADQALNDYSEWLMAKTHLSIQQVVNQGFYSNKHGLKGIDRLGLETLINRKKLTINQDAFMKGDGVILEVSDASLIPILSHILEISIESTTEDKLVTLPVEGVILPLEDDRENMLKYSEFNILISHQAMGRFLEEPQLLAVDFNAQKGQVESLDRALRSIEDMGLEISSKSKAERSMRQSKWLMLILGGGMAVILDLIGMINFINVISVSIMSRQKELATLESVGMTQKQILIMLITEGLLYAIITIFISLTIGNLIIYGLLRGVKRLIPYAVLTYPFGSIAFIYLLIILICYSVPLILYRQMHQMTLVERLGKEV